MVGVTPLEINKRNMFYHLLYSFKTIFNIEYFIKQQQSLDLNPKTPIFLQDILKMCPKNKKVCRQNGKEEDTEFVELQNEGPDRVSLQDGATWYHVLDKREIFEILDMCGDSDYMFVAGNTGHGKSGSSTDAVCFYLWAF